MPMTSQQARSANRASRGERRSAARRPRPTEGGAALGARLLRLWFAAASRVAPALAEQQAAMLFLTPRRRTARDPVIDGVPARRLAVDAGGRGSRDGAGGRARPCCWCTDGAGSPPT